MISPLFILVNNHTQIPYSPRFPQNHDHIYIHSPLPLFFTQREGGVMMQRGTEQCKKPISNYQSFVRRGKKIKMAAELGMARSSGADRRWKRALCGRLGNEPKPESQWMGSKEEAADRAPNSGEKDGEIERRIKALQRLVPGGEEMEVDALFEETADYIEALRGQVNVMRAMAEFMDGVARERRMMGG